MQDQVRTTVEGGGGKNALSPSNFNSSGMTLLASASSRPRKQ